MSTVKQISVLLENEPGKLSGVSELLGKEAINIGAMSLAESTDRSIVRLIADDPKKALQVLKGAKYHVWDVDVIAVVTPDHPGGLSAVLKPFGVEGVNVQYLYPHLRRYGDDAIIIYRVDDTKKAVEVLKENYIAVLGDELYSL